MYNVATLFTLADMTLPVKENLDTYNIYNTNHRDFFIIFCVIIILIALLVTFTRQLFKILREDVVIIEKVEDNTKNNDNVAMEVKVDDENTVTNSSEIENVDSEEDKTE